jgi:hypothetical protein
VYLEQAASASSAFYFWGKGLHCCVRAFLLLLLMMMILRDMF